MSYVPPINREIKDFYRDHVDSLYRSCCFLTGGQADPEAMTRDVFLQMLSKGMEFSSHKDARAWLLLTAYQLGKKKQYYLPKQEPPKAEAIAEPEPIAEPQPEPVSQPQPEEAASQPEPVSQPQPEETPSQPEPAGFDIGEAAPEKQEIDAQALTSQFRESFREPEGPAPEEAAQEEAAVQEKEPEPEEVPEAPATGEPPAQNPVLPAQPEEKQPDPFSEIRKLSRKNRLVALLYYCEGYRKAEIASYLGCPEFVIRSRLKQVKKVIQDDVGGEEAC